MSLKFIAHFWSWYFSVFRVYLWKIRTFNIQAGFGWVLARFKPYHVNYFLTKFQDPRSPFTLVLLYPKFIIPAATYECISTWQLSFHLYIRHKPSCLDSKHTHIYIYSTYLTLPRVYDSKVPNCSYLYL